MDRQFALPGPLPARKPSRNRGTGRTSESRHAAKKFLHGGVCNGLGCCLGKLVHLGIAKAPNKSTLSYANEHRPAQLYEDLFYTALNRFRDEEGLGARKKKFRFKNKLLSLDSTTISLCLELFPWAKFRRAKGGVKAHVLLDHDDYLPRYVLITEAKRSDVKMADAFTLNPGSIVAMDRGYNDYGLFFKWTTEEIYFVTRLKENAAYEVVEELAVPKDRNIRSDQLIRLTGVQAQKDCPCLLRRVVVWDAVNEREIVLLTNLIAFGATTIAAIYKDRWEIELFFKLAARWVVMTAAFIALLASGQLSGWAPWAFLRVVLALGGVLALEFSSFFLHSVFADGRVLPRYRIIFAVLATALPLFVMAAGFLSLRWLFLVGVGAAMIGGMYGSAGEKTFMKIKRSFLPASNPNENIDYLLLWANPMYEPNQLQEVFARIEQRPGWIGEVTQQLAGPSHLSAMYLLCRQPARLDEALQERCWTAVGAATMELDQQFQKEAHVTTSEALKLVEAVIGLAALPGPVRDRHRAEFLAAVEYLTRARADMSQLPDMGSLDWAGK